MKYLMTILIVCFVNLSCREKKYGAKKNRQLPDIEKSTKPEYLTITDTLKNNLTSQDLSYQPNTVNKNTWIPRQFLNSLYTKGVGQVHRNDQSYPYEAIYIDDWKEKKIFGESASLDYRKIRVKEVNDSTYYITNWNTHHYKNKDSIFITKRGKEISILIGNDNVPYVAGIGTYPFKKNSITKIINTISFYNKYFDLYQGNGNIMDKGISFNLSKNVINHSNNFRKFELTGYYLNNEYLIKLDSIDYFFNWKGDDVYLRSDNNQKMTLKQVN